MGRSRHGQFKHKKWGRQTPADNLASRPFEMSPNRRSRQRVGLVKLPRPPLPVKEPQLVDRPKSMAAAAIARYIKNEMSDRIYKIMRFSCNCTGCAVFINNAAADEPRNKRGHRAVGIMQLTFREDHMEIYRTVPSGDYDERMRITRQYIDKSSDFAPITLMYSDPKMFDKLEDTIVKAYNAWFV